MSGPAAAAPGPGSIGITAVGVAALRRAPDHGSELVSQALFGESFRIEEVSEDLAWWRIRLDTDGYAGWLRSWYGEGETAPDPSCAPARVRVRQTRLRLGAAGEAEVRAVLPWLARLRIRKRQGRWAEAVLPGGGTGYVLAEHLAPPHPEDRPPPDPARLLGTARALLGIPYLWGGRSVWGFDCSGFTQAIFARHGVRIARDARGQWETAAARGPRRGEADDPGRQPRAIRAGDLLFFASRPGDVTHVGLSSGGPDFLHALGRVRWGSLDPSSQVFSSQLFETFIGAWPAAPLEAAADVPRGVSA